MTPKSPRSTGERQTSRAHETTEMVGSAISHLGVLAAAGSSEHPGVYSDESFFALLDGELTVEQYVDETFEDARRQVTHTR